MESCLSPCPSLWSDQGLSTAPKRSLWAAQVTAALDHNMHCVETENASAVATMNNIERSQLLVNAHMQVDNLILSGSEQEAAAASGCTSSGLASTNYVAGDVKKQSTISGNVTACEDSENKAVAALRRMHKDGGSSLKRSAAAVADHCNNDQSFSTAPARVRARRGEATDQHSIQERTRRTKITERMRALHRLIPDASKTNKASMLDEVIQYVSMLQARLKMECMSKLDGRGADPSTLCTMDKEGWKRNVNRVYVNKMIERVLDPLEDKLAEAERQVLSRLSHPSHDLSLAASFLSTAGLTLMPISHLSSISSTS